MSYLGALDTPLRKIVNSPIREAEFIHPTESFPNKCSYREMRFLQIVFKLFSSTTLRKIHISILATIDVQKTEENVKQKAVI